MQLHVFLLFSELFSTFAGHPAPLTFCFSTANMLNTHEELRSRPGTWMVAGFLPNIDSEIAKYQKERGNSASVCNVELMEQCLECLFQGWNKTYSDPVPMEFADAQTTLIHVVAAALSISDQQEADKLLGDPLSCKYIMITCNLMQIHYNYMLFTFCLHANSDFSLSQFLGPRLPAPEVM